MGLKVGYHYATLDAWKRIAIEGLKPYLICREALAALGLGTVAGIWVWMQRLTGLAHSGAILYQMTTKGSTTVVLLQVCFEEDSILHIPDEPDKLILLHHSGHIGNLVYHNGKECAFVTIERIPPNRIELIGTYALNNVWLD